MDAIFLVIIRRTLIVPILNGVLISRCLHVPIHQLQSENQENSKFLCVSLPPDERVPNSPERTRAGFGPRQSQVEEVSEGMEFKIRIPSSLPSSTRLIHHPHSLLAVVLMQIPTKSLSAAFTSAFEDSSAEDLKEPAYSSSFSEVSEVDMNGELKEVRLDSQIGCDFA